MKEETYSSSTVWKRFTWFLNNSDIFQYVQVRFLIYPLMRFTAILLFLIVVEIYLPHIYIFIIPLDNDSQLKYIFWFHFEQQHEKSLIPDTKAHSVIISSHLMSLRIWWNMYDWNCTHWCLSVYKGSYCTNYKRMSHWRDMVINKLWLRGDYERIK